MRASPSLSPAVQRIQVRQLTMSLADDWGRHVATKLYGDRFQTLFDYLWLPSGDRMGALDLPADLATGSYRPVTTDELALVLG